ncbi:MAG TPA: DUF417 family protein [Pyrinomonadaceae bacterium]|jgi:uncharacterized membrane protein YkgB
MASTMTNIVISRARLSSTYANVLESVGTIILRYGLVAILLYFGAFKFHPVEAAGIEPLVAHSPLMSWLIPIMGVRGVSNLLGVTEITIAVLMALRSFLPTVSALGSIVAIGMFLITLTFLFTTPGMWAHVTGFPLPLPSASGGFLIKDVFLLGAAVWTTSEALRGA